LIQDEETEEEMTFEYEEKELEVTTVNVNMKLTSVQRDLKIKFVNHKTGKLIPHVEFKVSVEKADGKEKEYTDDDKDGIIYLSDMEPGKVTVTMLAMSGEEGLAFNTAPQTIKIKDKIEYKKIDVSEEVKSESEINAAIEDTAKENEVEAELKDTVEWVASTKTEVGVQESYVEVKKDNISDPSNTAKVTFLRMTQITESSAESTSSSENSSEDTSKQENATPTPPPETTTTPESTTPPETTTTPESTTPPETTTTPESTTSPESTTTPESTTEEETTTEETTTPPPSSTVPENPAKTDTVTPLKDNSGNQMYLRTSDGKFVEAKYADYYNDKAVFYKRLTTPASYKYTGWQNVDGKTYFYDKNNNAVTGEQVIQGAKYNFASDGALITGSGTLGIDVSKWNGNIDWNAVKNSGVSYVIIRCGYRGSTTGAMIEDPKFKTNIRGANAAGLKVGIYFFSQAVNEVEAVEEASMTINLIKNYSISYPVFLDVEPSGGRADGIDKNTRTQVIKAYCETIRNSGYTAGVYANKTWLTSYMNVGELGAYKIWLAQYNTAPTYSGRIDLWQYTSKGQVNGIGGHTDLNLSYLGY
jgi:GH25 family lysozyme M1 (1,4-beta-N-acetylmuramidase)